MAGLTFLSFVQLRQSGLKDALRLFFGKTAIMGVLSLLSLEVRRSSFFDIKICLVSTGDNFMQYLILVYALLLFR